MANFETVESENGERNYFVIGEPEMRSENFQLHLGLDRTWHMSFMTGQDRTLKFAGRVLPGRTDSGLIFLMIY